MNETGSRFRVRVGLLASFADAPHCGSLCRNRFSNAAVLGEMKDLDCRPYLVRSALVLAAALLLGVFLVAEDEESALLETSVKELEAALEAESKASQPERRDRRNRGRRERIDPVDLTPEQQLQMYIQQGDTDIFMKGGVVYRKSWAFRTGVTQLYPPLYDGWKNGKDVKGLYEDYADEGEPGYTLSSITYNDRFYQQTGAEFVNFFSLVWVPEAYAFSVFTNRSFETFKDTLRQRIIDARKQYADRDRFETFQDYIAFKFGRDDEMENFVDRYWIEANEGSGHLTYFYTSEFSGIKGKKNEAFTRPLIATATYMIVRNKLLRMDVVKEYDGQDEISILLEFTDKIRRDMIAVNLPGESK